MSQGFEEYELEAMRTANVVDAGAHETLNSYSLALAKDAAVLALGLEEMADASEVRRKKGGRHG